MALPVNLRHLERGPVTLRGELTPEELDLLNIDELIQFRGPACYDLTAQKIENGVLVQGRLAITLHCECGRCLKPFEMKVDMGEWTCHLLLEGEEAVIIANDSVDLTPHIREDILLALPQRPLCQPGCRGLPVKAASKSKKTGKPSQGGPLPSVWTELNKLKL